MASIISRISAERQKLVAKGSRPEFVTLSLPNLRQLMSEVKNAPGTSQTISQGKIEGLNIVVVGGTDALEVSPSTEEVVQRLTQLSVTLPDEEEPVLPWPPRWD